MIISSVGVSGHDSGTSFAFQNRALPVGTNQFDGVFAHIRVLVVEAHRRYLVCRLDGLTFWESRNLQCCVDGCDAAICPVRQKHPLIRRERLGCTVGRRRCVEHQRYRLARQLSPQQRVALHHLSVPRVGGRELHHVAQVERLGVFPCRAVTHLTASGHVYPRLAASLRVHHLRHVVSRGRLHLQVAHPRRRHLYCQPVLAGLHIEALFILHRAVHPHQPHRHLPGLIQPQHRLRTPLERVGVVRRKPRFHSFHFRNPHNDAVGSHRDDSVRIGQRLLPCVVQVGNLHRLERMVVAICVSRRETQLHLLCHRRHGDKRRQKNTDFFHNI